MDNGNDYVEHFRSRVLEDALIEATAAYWRRRADTYMAARPRPGDFTGAATSQQLRERWHRLTAIAEACRARAHVHDQAEIATAVRDARREAA